MIEQRAGKIISRRPVKFVTAREQRAQGRILRPRFVKHRFGEWRRDERERDFFRGQPLHEPFR